MGKWGKMRKWGQAFQFNSNFVDNLKRPNALRSEQASQICVLFESHLY